ncbi:hypothetical protein [Coxiella-like endosymbiont of Rhipicephalus sanguineus]|uniref:hypothetical protein n=1 Tax=Coxiella-like endosymbiont of Rhipicephalus sanguineus TaxID=1955402 RepID=UPI00203B853F|nr:hypothetical protein [Coxiella-like endosymbiont of Rhipicephalus sanguineus]
MTPKFSIETQKIGADIIMVFDECTPKNGDQEATLAALERIHRSLIQSKEVHDRVPYSSYGDRQTFKAAAPRLERKKYSNSLYH